MTGHLLEDFKADPQVRPDSCSMSLWRKVSWPLPLSELLFWEISWGNLGRFSSQKETLLFSNCLFCLPHCCLNKYCPRYLKQSPSKECLIYPKQDRFLKWLVCTSRSGEGLYFLPTCLYGPLSVSRHQYISSCFVSFPRWLMLPCNIVQLTIAGVD